MKLKLLATSIVLFFANNLISQQLFTAKYIMNQSGILTNALNCKSDSSYVFLGSNSRFDTVLQNNKGLSFVFKTDIMGNPISLKEIEYLTTYYSNFALGFCKNYEDSLFIYGYTTGFDSNNAQLYIPFIGKLGTDGGIGITKEFNYSKTDAFSKILTTSDNGLIVLGSKIVETIPDTINSKMFILKLDVNLNQQWARIYLDTGNADFVRPMDIIQLPDSGYIFIASVGEFYTRHLMITRVNKNGTIIWNKVNNDSIEGFAGDAAMVYTHDSCVVFITQAGISGGSGGYLSLSKIDLNGTIIWRKIEAFASPDPVNGFYLLPDNGFMLQTSRLLVKHNSNGLPISGVFQNPGTSNLVSSSLRTDDGGYVLAGYSYITQPGIARIMISLRDSDGYAACGNIIWNNLNSSSLSLPLDNYHIADSAIILTEKIITALSYDSLPVKQVLCATGDIEILEETEYLTVFPNPAIDLINLRSEQQINKVELFDVHGRMLIDFVLKTERIVFSIASLEKGMYLIKVQTENTSITKLVIKI